jgi:hypothetical protein
MFKNIRADLVFKICDWGAFLNCLSVSRWRYGVRPALLPLSLLAQGALLSIQIITGIELPCEVLCGADGHRTLAGGFARFAPTAYATVVGESAPHFADNVY